MKMPASSIFETKRNLPNRKASKNKKKHMIKRMDQWQQGSFITQSLTSSLTSSLTITSSIDDSISACKRPKHKRLYLLNKEIFWINENNL